MRFLIDICHPAHVHFFRYPVAMLHERGHEVLITSRFKEMAVPLLDRLGWTHRPLSTAGAGRPTGLLVELLRRNAALRRVVKEFRPHAMAAIGGTFVAQVGFLTRTPSVVFYDTENAKLQNLLTYPFASLVSVPACYSAWLPRHSERYRGYHELSYLHPERFRPDRDIAVANGLDPVRDNFLIRVVAWKANHDIGEKGWDAGLLQSVVEQLAWRGKVMISSESPLPKSLEALAYRGDPLQIHHVLAGCRLFVGESATMASEAAVLGVPAVYAARTSRGYTNEQQHRYGLVRNVSVLDADVIGKALDELLSIDASGWQACRGRLLEDTIDVASYVVETLESRSRRSPRPDQ